MLGKAIANWLTRVNERNYQLAFCQLLILEGHRVLYMSRHGPLERGCDLISIDPAGNYHAFQLKTGDLTLAGYQDILGELKEMMELPMRHPTIPDGIKHTSWLVANGKIADTVLDRIKIMNDDNVQKCRNYSQLKSSDYTDLLGRFVSQRDTLLGDSLIGLDAFVREYFSPAEQCVDKSQVDKILASSLPDGLEGKAFSRACANSILAVSIAMHSKYARSNYCALVEAWALTLGALRRQQLRNPDLAKECDGARVLISAELASLVRESVAELCKREDWFEGDPVGDGGAVYGARIIFCLGLLCAATEYLAAIQIPTEWDTSLLKVALRDSARGHLWNEGAFVHVCAISRFLESRAQFEPARKLLEAAARGILKSATEKDIPPLAPPYYGLEESLRNTLLGWPPEDESQDWKWCSYSVPLMIEACARRGLRDPIARDWAEISKTALLEFIPDCEEDHFSWRTEHGTNRHGPHPPRASWAELVGVSTSIPLLQKRLIVPEWLLWLVAAPHRASRRTCRLLQL